MRKATIVAMLLALATWLYPIKVAAAKTETNDELILINHVVRVSPPYEIQSNHLPQADPNMEEPKPVKRTVPSTGGGVSGRHSADSQTKITSEQLSTYLGSSPLAPYASQILQSKYWSTIIGICWIEESKCTINPRSSNNFYGMMNGGQLIRYSSIEAGITAVDAFLDKAYGNGKTTVESYRGWYCSSECTNWESTVIRIKTQLENYAINPTQ